MIAKSLHAIFIAFLVLIFIWLLGFVDNRHIFLTSIPTSNDQGQHGLALLKHLTSKTGLTAQPLMSGYHNLTTASTRQTNNLLFLTLPASAPANQDELANLASWVSNGNHIVALLALDDKPHWQNKLNKFTINDFLTTIDLQLSLLDSKQEMLPQSDEATRLISQLQHPVTQAVKHIHVSPQRLDNTWQLAGIQRPQSSLILLRAQDSLSPVAWLSNHGKGSLLLFSHSGIFSNENISQADNLTLASNILGYTTSNSATAYFDDIHHLTRISNKQSNAFLNPLLILLIAMLSYGLLAWLLKRLSKNISPSTLSLTNYVLIKSKQQTKLKSNSEVALNFAAYFFNDARSALGLAMNYQPVWNELKGCTTNKRLLANVEKHYQRALLAKKINLKKFVKRLEQLKSQIK